MVLKSNPNDLKPYRIADGLNIKKQDQLNHSLGMYIQAAISSCFGGKYPKEPYTAKKVLSKEQQIAAFVASMERMSEQWEKAHSKDEDNGGTE